MTWASLKQNFLASPKSSITGACGLAIAVTLAYMALPPKASTPVILLAVLRAVMQFASQDAGSTLVTTPQQPQPHAEASTEVPLNPDATPVNTASNSATGGPQ